MLRYLRAFVKRETLISIRNFILSIYANLYQFIPSIMAPPAKSQPSDSPELDPPKFDPSQPSIPISYPIKTLEELESRSYFDSFHYPFNKSSVQFPPSGFDSNCKLPNRARVLVCHDMAGGYTDDKWVQGGPNSDAYAIWHWYLMDVFVYFSHSLVTLPPPCWVNAAHKHGVKVLGTFITEWDEGTIICDKLLSSKESAHMYAERLSELAIAMGFDGWLINDYEGRKELFLYSREFIATEMIESRDDDLVRGMWNKINMEVKLNAAQIPNLKEFVSHLTDTMHSSNPGSLVIWYDSVTVNGDLDWQDQLNEKNKAFFDLCDGIFINYTWKEDYPKLSAEVAGDRKFDVYMGIDVFGRNTYGGGQWTTNIALDVIRKDDVSAAIFAPGWVYETNQPPDFQTSQNRWWALIEKSWGVMQKYPRETPFYSNFDQGRGHHFSVDGRRVSSADWCNLSCQSFQPFLELPDQDPGLDAIQVVVDLKEESYSGGGNVTFKGNLGNHAYITKRLFQANLLLGVPALHFTFSVKSDGDSLVGLSLEFSSGKDEKVSILLASHGNTLLTMNKFSSKFNNVIMPRQITKLELTDDGWVLQENAIAMTGYTLTEIRAVLYKLTPEKEKSDYYAVLGHLSIEALSQNIVFPPSYSWLVEVQSINWVTGSGQSKSVSLNILWRLKDGNYVNKFQNYHIYVEKISKEDGNMGDKKLQGIQEYLGMAVVEAFYVSNLLVPSNTYSLKFIIQVFGIDGTCQQLDNSPSFQLVVEG